MDFPNTYTNIQCLKKEDARLKLKRTRSSDRYELEQAAEAGAETEQMETVLESISIATLAIEDLEKGAVLCNFNTSMLVTGTSLDELKANVSKIITACKDRTILASKSLNQASDFLNVYVHRKPPKYLHMARLEFPLSFQQNAGATVGDTGEIWSPAIGTDF